MSDSSDENIPDSDSDQDLFDEQHRRRQRARARDEALYGVFYEGGDDDDYQYQRGGRGRGKRSDDGLNIAPQFVKGKTMQKFDEPSDNDDEYNNQNEFLS